MSFCRFLMFLAFLCSHSNAHTYYIGGKDGWTLHPSENYNRWADKHHFQINDTLVFEYEEGEDSVLVVNYIDYSICNKENPVKGSKNGHSAFKFKESGHFFFISGHDKNCEKGQKLNIRVLSPPHHRVISPSPAPSPSSKDHNTLLIPPSAHSPAPSVESPSPSPAPSPSTASDFRILFAHLVGYAIMAYAIYNL